MFENQYTEIDMLRLLKICIIHDLGEAISGDIAAVDQTEDIDKSKQERQDFETLVGPLSESLKSEILELWDEYESLFSRSIACKGF